jgi:hypothetical protein
LTVSEAIFSRDLKAIREKKNLQPTTLQKASIQGDQIGRIFACWAFVHIGQFWDKLQK